MLQKVRICDLDDYFLDLGKRKIKGVYFYRINGYNEQIHEFVKKYYEAARLSGVIIEGKLQNPSNDNLAYYNEIMGMNFQLSMGFITSALKKWLPRMNDLQRNNVAGSIYDTLMGLKQSGKNENMLKNAYIKFMCWLYYKFERIVHQLGNEKLPKILYEGEISIYELLLMDMLSIAGCDIILLQYRGDASYRKVDIDNSRSLELSIPGMRVFPENFNLKRIRQDIQDAINNERLYGERSRYRNCTNAWISGKVFDDLRTNVVMRGREQNFYYNCFCRINGVEDKLTYQNELYQLQLELRNTRHRLVIVNETIAPPTLDEINSVHRKNYQNVQQLIMDLSRNLIWAANQEMQKLMKTAFIDLILEESKKQENNIHRLTNRAVFLICWIKRYQGALFERWQMPEVSCFFFMGGCQNENEALFLRFLSKLPVDVVIFHPNLNIQCCLKDPLLFEVNNEISLNVSKYPEQKAGLRVGTVAYQAERDLDTLMYSDTGIYRNQQFRKANAVPLHTMYEEIFILWNQEMKYRPNFSTVDEVVNMPVIFAKVSGVKNGDQQKYWISIKQLLNEDTTLIKTVPNITSTSMNPTKAFATEFLRNGRVQKTKIKEHNAYQYGFLREAMQDHLLDKLQFLIDQKLIVGTFENGTEYTIVATALNIDKAMLRMIQKFDFTKKNPKLLYVITGETVLSLEDTIYMTYMNLIGFDVLFFVPTGYQCIERYLNKTIIEEHQIGEYVYDLNVPDFSTIPSTIRQSWRDKLFNRGI